MTRLSDANLELLRTRTQRTQLYMSIFQPRSVFKARVNNVSATRGDRTIPYDSVTLGSVGDVEAGMTLLVGTTEGAQDVGKIRIRSINGSQFVVSENSISWADNLYLTVLRYWELWPIFPRIINHPTNPEDVIFYKDYDLVYSNQNSILGTFPCAGNHQALFKGEQVYYSNSGTANLLGDTLSHNWFFEGASVTGSISATPGFITYPTPGHYVTRYIVSGSSGGVDTTYRYVSVYDRPGEGNSPPIGKWSVSNLAGSRDEGGYRATFTVFEDVPIDENSVVILFSEDWYGSTKQSLGGNSINNERIFFVGHVLRGTIRYDYSQSKIEFEVGSITEVMKDALGFSVSVESKISPTTWYELYDMDCRRAIYHYLKWHTTALSIADFQFVGTDFKIQFFDADRTSIYDAIDNLMRNTLVGKSVSDRQGKVWMEIDAGAYSNPTGSFSSVMEITKRDWMGEPTIEERFSDQLSYFEMGGIHYSGVSTGTFSALLACAPGSAPSFRGRIETPDGYAIGGQPHLNQLVGNIFANANSRLPSIDMEMAISTRNLDIAPQETVHMNILESDTVRGKPVDGLYIPEEITWRYDPRNQILLASINYKHLVSGVSGETIGIPESVSEAGFDSGGFGVPQLQIPPLPILTIPPSLANAIANVINNGSFLPFLCDYAFAIYNGSTGWETGNRGINIDITSKSGVNLTIQFTITHAGVYVALANLVSLTGAQSASDQVIIYQDGVVKYFTSADNEPTDISGSCGGILIASASIPIKMTNNPSAQISDIYHASFGIVRISP